MAEYYYVDYDKYGAVRGLSQAYRGPRGAEITGKRQSKEGYMWPDWIYSIPNRDQIVNQESFPWLALVQDFLNYQAGLGQPLMYSTYELPPTAGSGKIRYGPVTPKLFFTDWVPPEIEPWSTSERILERIENDERYRERVMGNPLFPHSKKQKSYYSNWYLPSQYLAGNITQELYNEQGGALSRNPDMAKRYYELAVKEAKETLGLTDEGLIPLNRYLYYTQEDPYKGFPIVPINPFNPVTLYINPETKEITEQKLFEPAPFDPSILGSVKGLGLNLPSELITNWPTGVVGAASTPVETPVVASTPAPTPVPTETPMATPTQPVTTPTVTSARGTLLHPRRSFSPHLNQERYGDLLARGFPGWNLWSRK